MLREATYSTVRYGAYDPIKSWLQASALGAGYTRSHGQQAAAAASRGANETQAMPMSLKILAGGMAGGFSGGRRSGVYPV
jgi:hypothetical protein